MGSSDRCRRLPLLVLFTLTLVVGLLTDALIAQGGGGGVPKRTLKRDNGYSGQSSLSIPP